MKVLITNYEFPPVGGGAGDVSYNLAKRFARNGHQIEVLTSRFRDIPQRETREGYKVHRFLAPRKKIESTNPFELLLFALLGILPMLRLIRKFKPDLIHGHSLIPAGLLCLMANLTYQVPFVLTFQGGDAPGAISSSTNLVNLMLKLLKPINTLILRRASLVTAVSNNLVNLIKQSFPDTKITIIPNGVDTDFYIPKPQKNPKFTFTYCGRLSPEKGIPTLYEATKILHSQYPEKFLVRLLGDGPLRKGLEKKISQNQLKDVFEITGWVDKESVRDFLQASDVFILPSHFEALSTALLQALACGLPAIYSDLPGSERLVKNELNGLRFEPRNAHALEGTMSGIMFLSREKLKQMGEESRKIALKYSWDKIVQDYQRAFDSLK